MTEEETRAVAWQESQKRGRRAMLRRRAALRGSETARRQATDRWAPWMKPGRRWWAR